MPSPFHGYPKGAHGRNGYSAIAICNHITDYVGESWEPFDRWFTSQGKVAPNYCVLRNGVITQYVDEDDAAWTQGVVNTPNLTIPWIAHLIAARGLNPNLLCISIEQEGKPNLPLTEAQYQSTLWLHRDIIRRHGMLPDRNHIVGHCDFNSVDKANCPGPLFPWTKLLADLN